MSQGQLVISPHMSLFIRFRCAIGRNKGQTQKAQGIWALGYMAHILPIYALHTLNPKLLIPPEVLLLYNCRRIRHSRCFSTTVGVSGTRAPALQLSEDQVLVLLLYTCRRVRRPRSFSTTVGGSGTCASSLQFSEGQTPALLLYNCRSIRHSRSFPYNCRTIKRSCSFSTTVGRSGARAPSLQLSGDQALALLLYNCRKIRHSRSFSTTVG